MVFKNCNKPLGQVIKDIYEHSNVCHRLFL